MDNWKIIHECDDEETGKHSLWAMEIDDSELGKYIWISLQSDKKYHVEIFRNNEFETLQKFRSLKSAKNYANQFRGF